MSKTMLYPDPDQAGLIHASTSCRQGLGVTVDVTLVALGKRDQELCSRAECANVLTSGELSAVLSLTRARLDLTPSKIQRSPDLAIHRRGGAEYLWEHHRTQGKDERRRISLLEDAVSDLQVALSLASGHMLTSEYKEALYTEWLSHNIVKTYQEELTRRGMGDVSDPGLLVGTVTSDAAINVLHTLKYTGHLEDPAELIIMQAPLGVLLRLSDWRPEGAGTLGRKRQVVALPPGYDPDLEELIRGLFRPEEEGPMGDLKDVVHAAMLIRGRR